MSSTDIAVIVFILTAFGAFMATLAWASRPPRKTPRTGELPVGRRQEHAPSPVAPRAAAQ